MDSRAVQALTLRRMQRVRVVGNSGSGKTRLAAEIAQCLQVPHLELDALQHGPAWDPAPLDVFKRRLGAFLANSEKSGGWVIDGNYNDRAAGLFDLADTIVWLDYPRRVVMARLLRRTLLRIAFRRELWNGNRESLGRVFTRDPDTNVLLWAWTQHEQYRRRYRASMQDPTCVWVRLSTPSETRRWLRRCVT